MKKLFRYVASLAVVLGAFWLLGPYEPAPLTPTLKAAEIPTDVDAYFKASEAQHSDITPGTEKRVIWAGAQGQKTDWAVVYIHGFSATSEEIRPVPDRVAETLGANLVYTRLKGHGRGSAAMGEATVQDWINDVAEAFEVSRRVGDRVLVISTSTGGTLVAAAAHDPDMFKAVAGSVFVSPNFGVNSAAAPLLTWPGAKYWLPLLVGSEREFEPRNPKQAEYWTTKYPSTAVSPMAALVKKTVALDHTQVKTPALFIFSDEDKVVNPAITRQIVKSWGGPLQVLNPELTAQDDSHAHVIAGDVLSPNQTDPTIREILSWVDTL